MQLGFNDAWRHEHKANLYDLGADFDYIGAKVIRYPWVWQTETDKELFQGIRKARGASLNPILCPYSYTNDYDNIDNYLSVLQTIGDKFPNLPIEVLNEPNLPNYGAYTALEYANLFREAYATIRSVGNPDRKILASGGALSPYSLDSWWLQDFSNATSDLDYIVSSHFYSGQKGVLGPSQVVGNILAVTRKRFPDREIWCTEVGYPSGTLGTIKSNEMVQEYWISSLVKELIYQGIPKICIHRLYDLQEYDQVKWGVKDIDGNWKPSGNALKNIVSYSYL